MKIERTAIDGLKLLRLDVHEDERGWFKENWQRESMIAAGLPDFGPVQHNLSYNEAAGTIRGVHAEPWDKLVSIAHGRAFGAWVDLREGDGFGTVVWVELDPATAVFVPRGVGNSFQTLEPHTSYSYLVNDHWRADAQYVNVNLFDESLSIPWPLPPARMSAKDASHPLLAEVTPVSRDPRAGSRGATVVIGRDGQLARALAEVMPDARFLARDEVDLADPATFERIDWPVVDTLIVAAAYTAVDQAETAAGRIEAWQVNVEALVHLARLATAHDVTLVTVSSDYVFDGTRETHDVDEPVAPLGVYGQTKAAGEAVTRTVPRHLVVRTSWVVGDGSNFVATMRRLAREGFTPAVVDDQIGVLTPAAELASGIDALLARGIRHGIHHVTGAGPTRSWADIAREIFEEEGRNPGDVRPVSTAEYAVGLAGPIAPRPRFSTLVTSGEFDSERA